jgi:hypothetical protein
MITYTWSISQLDCAPSENGLTNVVKVIHWGLTGQDENGVSASIDNLYPLSEPNPEAFADYSTLTEETVVGWLQNSLDLGYLHEVLANKIERNYNSPIAPLPLPWIRVEEVVPTEEPILEEVFLTEEEVITNEYNSNTTEVESIIQEEIT